MKLIFTYIIVVLITSSCTNSPKADSVNSPNNTTFCVIQGDSVFKRQYDLRIKTVGYTKYYEYMNEKGQPELTLLYDSTKNSLLTISLKKDTTLLKFDEEKLITHNGNTTQVLKFVQNPDSQDGIVWYYIDRTDGLLVVKSETWPEARYLLPDAANDECFLKQALISQLLFR